MSTKTKKQPNITKICIGKLHTLIYAVIEDYENEGGSLVDPTTHQTYGNITNDNDNDKFVGVKERVKFSLTVRNIINEIFTNIFYEFAAINQYTTEVTTVEDILKNLSNQSITYQLFVNKIDTSKFGPVLTTHKVPKQDDIYCLFTHYMLNENIREVLVDLHDVFINLLKYFAWYLGTFMYYGVKTVYVVQQSEMYTMLINCGVTSSSLDRVLQKIRQMARERREMLEQKKIAKQALAQTVNEDHIVEDPDNST